MKGVSFVIDSQRRKVAVQIDLTHARNRKLWSDVYDQLVADERLSANGVPLKTAGSKTATRSRARRKILFPTEPTSIDPKRIEKAVDEVVARSRKKKVRR